jgi:hypothetical protein
MCMIDDCEKATLIGGADHKARKEHKCAECFRAIGIGETYRAEQFVFDGDFINHKTCAHCMVARMWLQAECGGWLYGGVEEDIAEHVNGFPGGYAIGVLRLVIGMRNHWRRRDGSVRGVPAMPATTHERMAAQPGERKEGGEA